MSDLSLLAAALAKEAQFQATTKQPLPPPQLSAFDWTPRSQSTVGAANLLPNVQPDSNRRSTEFSQPSIVGPRSGSQLYIQRFAALRSGHLYTRLPIDSFRPVWQQAAGNPSYSQWRRLLSLEAKAAAGGQGHRRLAVMVGDSLSLWFPSDRLPAGQIWLNQAISGENTREILQRLSDFATVRPHAIYVMAGVNDLKQGASDNEILWNLRQIVWRLKRTHPTARIVVQSILPTRTTLVPGDRIPQLNQRLAAIAKQDGAVFLDLYSQLVDADGHLRPELTTDGLHLNANGYEAWQAGLWRADTWIAQNEG